MQVKYVLSDSIDFRSFQIWEYLHRLLKTQSIFFDLRFYEWQCPLCVRKHYSKIVVNLMEDIHLVSIWVLFASSSIGNDTIF